MFSIAVKFLDQLTSAKKVFLFGIIVIVVGIRETTMYDVEERLRLGLWWPPHVVHGCLS